jgi:hypothetical protein
VDGTPIKTPYPISCACRLVAVLEQTLKAWSRTGKACLPKYEQSRGRSADLKTFPSLHRGWVFNVVEVIACFKMLFCTHSHSCTRVHAHTCTYTYTHVHIHTHTRRPGCHCGKGFSRAAPRAACHGASAGPDFTPVSTCPLMCVYVCVIFCVCIFYVCTFCVCVHMPSSVCAHACFCVCISGLLLCVHLWPAFVCASLACFCVCTCLLLCVHLLCLHLLCISGLQQLKGKGT